MTEASAMEHSKYLIAGSSHAALEALKAIRMLDQESSLTLVTRDQRLPYSPTVLPYVVSGQSVPEKVQLRDDDYFDSHSVHFIRGKGIATVDTDQNTVTLDSGEELEYEKLLLATGAYPTIPPVEGLDNVSYHVLRTMEDAVGLRDALGRAKSAVVLGGGLIGMHAAENLIKAEVDVTIVEMRRQVLPGYFDEKAGHLIQRAFADNGTAMRIGETVVAAAKKGDGISVTLDGGDALLADLLLVCTGVTPAISYLRDSTVETDRGILVDDNMATNVENVWAAGDVAQARDFYGDDKTIGGILPAAVEQGRIAGMAMIDDPGIKPYPGNVPLNTYSFFGNQAVSVGASDETKFSGEVEAFLDVNEDDMFYQKILLRDDRLIGISGINASFDPGIMWQLILLAADLGPVKKQFLDNPLDVGRDVMSRLWR
jgi:phenylglyoxylate dehydrogenase epsilon subunit